MRDLIALPKAELHVHLEGAIRIATVRELADRAGASTPSGLAGEGWRFAGFDDFIEQYTATCALLAEPEDFRRIAYEFCEEEARNGVRYAEVVFSPSNHAPRLGDDWFGPIEAVLDGLEAGRLSIAGRDAESIAREHGTPLYVYDLVRAEEQVRALQGALGRAGLRHKVRLALKAQREPAFLASLRDLGAPGTPESVGMDVCSPGELRWAVEHGWKAEEISYTGTNMSARDLDAVLDTGVHLNVDLLSQLERVGRRAPGSSVGVRINPRIGAAFPGGGQTYAGDRPTKFGIYPERLDEALDIARRHDLTIDTVHVHAGYLYLSDALPVVDETMRRVAAAARALMAAGCPIVEVNTGGGLGVRFRPTDRPLDLDAWAAVLAQHLGPLDVAVGTEPGEFLAKECAVHLAEVVSVEDRDGTTFVGLDTGWNVMNEHFVYKIPFHPILCRAADAEPVTDVTVSGHINEGNDLFAEDHPMPEVEEGDIVAIPNVGSYNASMVSVHCLRPEPSSVFFTDRL